VDATILPPVPGQPGAAPSFASATQRDRENLARFAISTSKFFGVSMANMKVLATAMSQAIRKRGTFTATSCGT
jgi:hypothetical protein